MEKNQRPCFAGGVTCWSLLISGLVLLGLAARIYKAWTIQFAPDSDHGIVLLMAKHMSEGVDFPAFFYGQPYMGSLEPAISALVCKLFGVSSFHVCLGTVLAGIALLPLIYLWGRNAGGRYAGLAALLLALVGSNTNFHFSVAPRGGYSAMMACGVGTVFLACRIVTRLKAGQRVNLISYIGLGLLAGLGWWSNQLVVAFLLAAVVILLAGFSWRIVRDGAIPALFAFFAGSAPWWFWNATHEWGTFDFSEALGRLTLAQGVSAFFSIFLKINDLATPRNVMATAALWVMGALLLFFLVLLIRDRAHRVESDRFYFRLAAPVMVLSLAAVSVTSKYIAGGETSRYLLPVLPPLAVMLGWSAGWFMERRHSWLGWLLVAAMVPAHLYSLPSLRADLDYGRRAWKDVAPMVQTVAPLCDGVCYGDYSSHWLNFASGEALCVATQPWERYAPYGRRAELSENPAFIDDYCGLHAFLSYTKGRCRETNAAGRHVDYDLTPPPGNWRYVDESAIVAIRDVNGASFRKALTDNTMHTAWNASLKGNKTAGLAVEFDRPTSLCGVRFISRAGTPPGYLTIEMQSPGRSDWQKILPWTAPGGYFWSGSHLKLEGLQTFEEIRWTCPTGGVTRLRMKFGLADSRPRTFSLDEILFLEQTSLEAEAVTPTVDECLEMLKRKEVRQFRGPRWMTERLAARDIGTMRLPIPSFVKRSVQDLPCVDSSHADLVSFDERTGLLMDMRDAPRTRAVLGKCGQQWDEQPLGALILMVVSKAADGDDEIRSTPVYWTEQGCFAEESSRTLKKRSEWVFQDAKAQKALGNTGAMPGLLGKALSLYEWHQPARQALSKALKEAGLKPEAEFQEAILSEQTRPVIPSPATFRGSIQLLGLTLSTNEIAPGQCFDITYFWKCPPTVKTRLFAAYVNFQKGRERFQDDHVLLEDLLDENITYQPFDEVFSYTHRITVPASTTPGDYGIVIGLVERNSRKRLKPDTHLKVFKKGVVTPAGITITSRFNP